MLGADDAISLESCSGTAAASGGAVAGRFGRLMAGLLVAVLVVAGCDARSGGRVASKPKPSKAKPTKPAASKSKPSGRPPVAAPNDATAADAASAGHPTDALGWKPGEPAGEEPAGEEPADSSGGIDGEKPRAADDVAFGDDVTSGATTDDADKTPTDGAASTVAADADNGNAEAGDDAAAKVDKPKPPAVDFAALENELVAAKQSLSAVAKVDAADEDAAAEREKAKERFVSDALSLVDVAVEADDYPRAQRAVALAMEIGPTLADTELAGEVVKAKRKVAQFETAYGRAVAAREALAADDAAAVPNSGVGSYLCYLQGKWDEGLPYLAKGEDAAAKKAATLDLARPTAPDAQREVADAWWSVAARQGGVAKAQVMLRARHWYDQMRRSLDTAEQEKLRARIEMIDKYAVATGVNVELGLEAATSDASTGKLSPSQRGRVQQLLADFRRAAGNPARLETTANKLLTIGGPAVSQLLLEVNKQLQPQLRGYGEAFTQQAAAVQASRGGANMTEVERLRAQVLALKEMPNLTKDMIVQQGDPAMAKLSEMLVVEPRMVLERSAKLREERTKLLALGRQWERASQYLIVAMREEEAKAKAADRRATAEANAAPNADAAADEPPPLPSFEAYLAGEEELAAKMVMPMDDAARATLAENGKLIGQIETEEGRAILACNLTRQLLGLSVLKIDLKLCEAARDHSTDMATLGFFAHESPVPGKKTPWDRAANFGTSASGENIAMGYADGNAANQGWFHSPGHHKNMLGNHNRIGLGVYQAHYTELFGR